MSEFLLHCKCGNSFDVNDFSKCFTKNCCVNESYCVDCNVCKRHFCAICLGDEHKDDDDENRVENRVENCYKKFLSENLNKEIEICEIAERLFWYHYYYRYYVENSLENNNNNNIVDDDMKRRVDEVTKCIEKLFEK